MVPSRQSSQVVADGNRPEGDMSMWSLYEYKKIVGFPMILDEKSEMKSLIVGRRRILTYPAIFSEFFLLPTT